MAAQAESKAHSHEAPWNSGYLQVDEIHQLYYEEYGNKTGKPVVFLHGGPGGQTSIKSAIFFDPSIYHVVLFDQRGAGKSKPNAELRENTTWHLVSDIERIRDHLKIKKWHMVFGGSWGSTLALLYAQTYPQMVGSLVLRGIFTVRKSELDWGQAIGGGASQLFPEYFEEFVNFLPEDERTDLAKSYYKRLTSDDYVTRLEAAKAWNKWELSLGTLLIDTEGFKVLEDENWVMAHARMEAHYTEHNAWLEEGQILRKENIDKIRHIPATIVQGRYDVVCPPQTAWDLHKAWPESRLFWVPDAGHSAGEPGTQKKLVEVCDEYGQLDFH